MEHEQVQLGLQVFRFGSGDRDNPEALKFHKLRGRALHEMFDDDSNTEVVAWGDTEDDKAHESVTIALIIKALAWIAANPVAGTVATGAAGSLASKIIEKALEDLPADYLKDGIKYVIEKLWRSWKTWRLTATKQEETKKIKGIAFRRPKDWKVIVEVELNEDEDGNDLVMIIRHNGKPRTIHLDLTTSE